MPVSTPVQQLLHWANTAPTDCFLRQPVNGQWQTISYATAADHCKRMAQALRSMGIQPGDKVALLSKNCAEWIMADIAMMMAGVVSVPIYPTLTAGSIESILVHSESKAIIAGKLDQFEKQRSGIPANVRIIGNNSYNSKGDVQWEDLIASHTPIDEVFAWNPADTLTIIYTSGTTGAPKGVMHSLNAIDTVIHRATADIPLPPRPKLFSYLPLSHIAERMGIEFNALYNGGCVSFAESLDTFAENLADTQPDVFFAVPRIWIKFREKILQKLPQKKLNLLLSIPFVNSLIRKKIKTSLGLSTAKFIVSAAAPLAKEVQEWYSTLGIDICQAYGMTEDCVYAHFNRPGRNKFGTVGLPLQGLKVKFSEEKEIRVKSEGNMQGYYKEPAMTADMFDEEGYLKTGDIGELDADGYLMITGRVKDQFKTDKGKYIAPAPIETSMLTNHHLEQVCVVGTGIPQPIALVTLSDSGKMQQQDALYAQLEADIQLLNKTLEKHERIEKIVILANNWTVENGLLTPSLKVKRNELEKIYLPHYPMWYSKPTTIVRDNG